MSLILALKRQRQVESSVSLRTTLSTNRVPGQSKATHRNPDLKGKKKTIKSKRQQEPPTKEPSRLSGNFPPV